MTAGAIFSIAGVELFKKWNFSFEKQIVVAVVLTLIGAGILALFPRALTLMLKIFFRWRKVVAIFAPHEIDNFNSSWVELTISEIKKLLKDRGIHFCRIKTDYLLDLFPICLNPYGGVYPEVDAGKLVSLEKIFSYVNKGGVYINVSDIPFYFAFDRSLHRRVDITPLNFAESKGFNRFFDFSVTASKFFVQIKGSLDNESFGRRFSLEDRMINFDQKLHIDNGIKYSRFVGVGYGKGFFIFSTEAMNRDNLNRIVDCISKGFELSNRRGHSI